MSRTSRSRILVIDDHYAVDSRGAYGRADFIDEFSSLPFEFVFDSAWDESRSQFSVERAVEAALQSRVAGILLDLHFGTQTTDLLGLEILKRLTFERPDLPVIMMTSAPRDRVWQTCVELGAVDYLPKPLDRSLLHITLSRYVGAEPEHWVIGQNHLFLDAVNLVALAGAGGRTATIITGESGTGKTLLARFLHRHGARASGPFEIIDLANIPAEMQAAELFGYRKGAFTGALRDEPGRFASADTGVVFLDEIGNIDGSTQARLLRVVDGNEISQLGGAGKLRSIDVQVVSATNADLMERIRAKEFRYDLWARLNAMPVSVPSLEQRKDDIPQLVVHLLRCEAMRRSYAMPDLAYVPWRALQSSAWHGNIRGLRHYAQRVMDLIMAGTTPHVAFRQAIIGTRDDQRERRKPSQPLSFPAPDRLPSARESLQAIRLDEIALLDRALRETSDPVTGSLNRARAAAWLKGGGRCSTNQFDRWLDGLWRELTPENQEAALARLPCLAHALKARPESAKD